MSFPNANIVDASGAIINHAGRDQYNIQYATPATSDLHRLLAPVDDASCTRGGTKAECLQGTREDVIEQITQCVDCHHHICWLNGPAGSGKSAISQTIAERYAAQGRLGASFFFLRGAGDRSIIARLIRTLAYQLSLSIGGTQQSIRDVILREPGIDRQDLEYQFKRLIVEPMLAARSGFLARLRKPVVIVIDALDECNDKHQIAKFIEVVISAFQKNHHLPFRVVVMSRVEEHIREKLEASAAGPVMHRLSLQDFDARLDILKLFRSRFSHIYDEKKRLMRNVPLPWPSESDLQALAGKCDGSFIFACTLMDFIQKSIYDESGLPQEILQKALIVDAGLDALYAQVISAAQCGDNFERVIGTIMLLRAPLSITAVGELLQLEAEYIVQTLLGIQSILLIPGDDDKPIQLLHTSLRDFMVAKSRSDQFYIDPPHRHIFLTIDCLMAMIMPPNEDIVYGGGQEYAGLNWCHHLCQVLVEAGDNALGLLSVVFLNSLKDFVSQSYDFWINTLLYKGWKNTLDDLDAVLSTLKTLPNYPLELVQHLEDIKANAKNDMDAFFWFVRYVRGQDRGFRGFFLKWIKDWRGSQHGERNETGNGFEKRKL